MKSVVTWPNLASTKILMASLSFFAYSLEILFPLSIFTTDLDEELAKDLQEFEVVTGADSGKVDEDEINRELENFDMK